MNVMDWLFRIVMNRSERIARSLGAARGESRLFLLPGWTQKSRSLRQKATLKNKDRHDAHQQIFSKISRFVPLFGLEAPTNRHWNNQIIFFVLLNAQLNTRSTSAIVEPMPIWPAINPR